MDIFLLSNVLTNKLEFFGFGSPPVTNNIKFLLSPLHYKKLRYILFSLHTRWHVWYNGYITEYAVSQIYKWTSCIHINARMYSNRLPYLDYFYSLLIFIINKIAHFRLFFITDHWYLKVSTEERSVLFNLILFMNSSDFFSLSLPIIKVPFISYV